MELCSCSVSVQGGCGEVAFFFSPWIKQNYVCSCLMGYFTTAG